MVKIINCYIEAGPQLFFQFNYIEHGMNVEFINVNELYYYKL